MRYRVLTQALCGLGLLVLCGCASTISPSSVAPSPLAISQEQASIHALQRQLQERERTISIQNYKIAVLSNQLDDLKRIDQDMREPRRPVRNPTMVAPSR